MAIKKNGTHLEDTFPLLLQTSAHSGRTGHMRGGNASLQPVGEKKGLFGYLKKKTTTSVVGSQTTVAVCLLAALSFNIKFGQCLTFRHLNETRAY